MMTNAEDCLSPWHVCSVHLALVVRRMKGLGGGKVWVLESTYCAVVRCQNCMSLAADVDGYRRTRSAP